MKAEFDQEIDSLLREGARRGRAASGAGSMRADGGAHTAAHLDADEQGAYAENALPAAARAHYTAHLADCDDCRRSVTQLALAAGTAAQLEARETATARAASSNVTWRERLGALFAPRAWRYAVPALVLLLVSAASLIVLTRRAQREGTSIAEQRNTSSAQRPQAAQQQPQLPEAHHAPQNADRAASATPGVENAPDSNALASNPVTLSSKEEIAANSQRTENVQPLVGTGGNDTVAAPPPPVPTSASSGAGVAARDTPAYPAPTPAPVVGEVVTITSDQEAKAKSGERGADLRRAETKPGDFENRQYENRRREQVSGPQRNNDMARNARTMNSDESRNRDDKQNGNPAAATAASAPRAAAKRSREPEADRRKDENRPAEDATRNESERMEVVAATRTVAGRKFRRQGNAWIDTAYSAGQSYTVVRRNSEQFRALVADEPELRRIAGALGGEVTVVWKGRAYRIR